MARRLQIADRLLSESGCILISINDIEYAQLRIRQNALKKELRRLDRAIR